MRVRYGGGDVEVMNELAKVSIVTLGQQLIWWAYVSKRLPFDVLLGEDFLQDRVILDYTTYEIKFKDDSVAVAYGSVLPKVEPFPWGKGKPQAEMLHHGSTREEQDAVLAEELENLTRIEDPNMKLMVEGYICKFHEINKYGWVPAKWEPYTTEFTDPGSDGSSVCKYTYTPDK